MCEIEVSVNRKDSRRKISEALKKALGDDQTVVKFVKPSNGKAKRGMTALVTSCADNGADVLSKTRSVLQTLSRGRSVLVYNIRSISI